MVLSHFYLQPQTFYAIILKILVNILYGEHTARIYVMLSHFV